MDEESLERQAMEELMLEAKRGAERAKDMGAMGWQKPSVAPTNKRFLTNMLVSTLRDAERQARKQLDQVKEKDLHKYDTKEHPYRRVRFSLGKKNNYSDSHQRASRNLKVGPSEAYALPIPSKWDKDEKREHRQKFNMEVMEEANANSTTVSTVHEDRSGSDHDEAVITSDKTMKNNRINQKQKLKDSKRRVKHEKKELVKKNGKELEIQDDSMIPNNFEKRNSRLEKFDNRLGSRLAEVTGSDLQHDNDVEETLSQNEYTICDITPKQTNTTVAKEKNGISKNRKRKKSKERHNGVDYISQMCFDDLPKGNGSKTNHKCKKNKGKKKSKHKRNDN